MRGAIVMAAGAGRRMGGLPKGLLRRDGEPLVLRQLRLLRGAGLERVALVLGHHAEAIEATLQAAGAVQVRRVCNPDPDAGPGGSLRCGLTALGSEVDEVVVLLADQPLLEQQDLQAMLDAWRDRPDGIELVFPEHQGEPGHPIVFGPRLRSLLLQSTTGGVREWRRAHPAQALAVPVAHARCTTDVDTPQDLVRLEEAFGVRLLHAGGGSESLAINRRG